MRNWRLVIATFTCVCLGATLAHAQSKPPRIPDSVLRSRGTMSALDLKRIKDYVEYWIGQLAVAVDDPGTTSEINKRVATARMELIAPFVDSKGTENFRKAYSRQLSLYMLNNPDTDKRVLEPEQRVTVRLNALIVANKLVDPGCVDIIAKGLNDTNEGCRYWAAKAVSSLAQDDKGPLQSNDKDNKKLQEQLLGRLKVTLNKEDSIRVKTVLARALVDMRKEDAADAVLKWMNGRIDKLALASEAESVAPELAAMKQIYQKAHIQDNLTLKGPRLKLLARVSFRLLRLAAGVIAKRAPDDERVSEQYKALIVECNDRILRRYLMPRFLGNQPAKPKDVRRMVEVNEPQWTQIRLDIEDWEGHLIGDKIKLNPPDLTVRLREDSESSE